MEKKSRRNWTQDQKRKLAGEARRRREAGEKMAAVSKTLGVLEGSLRLWMKQFPPTRFVPVRLEAPESRRSADSKAEPGSLGNAISLTTPSGARFDGLDVGDVAVLLEQLQ